MKTLLYLITLTLVCCSQKDYVEMDKPSFDIGLAKEGQVTFLTDTKVEKHFQLKFHLSTNKEESYLAETFKKHLLQTSIMKTDESKITLKIKGISVEFTFKGDKNILGSFVIAQMDYLLINNGQFEFYFTENPERVAEIKAHDLFKEERNKTYIDLESVKPISASAFQRLNRIDHKFVFYENVLYPMSEGKYLPMTCVLDISNESKFDILINKSFATDIAEKNNLIPKELFTKVNKPVEMTPLIMDFREFKGFTHSPCILTARYMIAREGLVVEGNTYYYPKFPPK